MQPEYYYEIHYAIPSISMLSVSHWYVLCEGGILKPVHEVSSLLIPSLKFDSESSASQSVAPTDILTQEYKIVQCEYEF